MDSEIELPELTSVKDIEADIKIRLGETGTHLSKPRSKGVLYETDIDDFIFRIESVASYRVKNGNEILLEPNPNATPEEVRLFLYGSTMGALLHQRGILPLHGSAVKLNSGALIITGYSSAGKSTVAASLSQLGYQIIADDISAIAKDSMGEFVVFPGIPYLKLWKDVIPELNLNMKLDKVRPQLEKYMLPYIQNQHQEPVEVVGVCVLLPSNEKVMKSTRILGAQKFRLLKTHTYRSNYISGLGRSEIQFKNISELAKMTPVYEVTRPNAPMKLKELSELIEREIINHL